MERHCVGSTYYKYFFYCLSSICQITSGKRKELSTDPKFRPKGMMSRKEVATELNVPSHTIRYWTEIGRLKGKPYDLAGNKIYYKKEDVLKLKEELNKDYE